MLKNIAISDLVIDMYVSELISSKADSMPKKKKGMIKDQRIISKFIEIGIEHVIIDTEKGRDVVNIETPLGTASKARKNPTFIPSLKEGLSDINKQISTEYQSLSLEWGNAKEIFQTSTSIILETRKAIQNGQQFNLDYFDDASKAISRSILRNKDALTWLGRIRNKNNYLYEHSVNSATLMGIFAHAHGLNIIQIGQCITGALLHDVGHAHVNEEYLEREGPLSNEEFEEVKNHVNLGLDIIKEEDYVHIIAKQIIHEHHERYNGSGYPQGLKGKNISLFGRMFAIVDTYDAVTNNRHYKEAIPSSTGMRTLLELSKTDFDEHLVHQFIKCMGVYPTGSLARLNNGLLAVIIAQNSVSPLKPLIKAIFNTKTDAYIKPTMIDLGNKNEDIKIVGYENPHDFNIDIDNFTPEGMG